MADRCRSCREDRLDGQPCDIPTCLCRCHRIGVSKAENLQATVKYVPKRRRYIGDFLSTWEVPMSFDEEVKAGKFGPVEPEPKPKVIQFPKADDV